LSKTLRKVTIHRKDAKSAKDN